MRASLLLAIGLVLLVVAIVCGAYLFIPQERRSVTASIAGATLQPPATARSTGAHTPTITRTATPKDTRTPIPTATKTSVPTWTFIVVCIFIFLLVGIFVFVWTHRATRPGCLTMFGVSGVLVVIGIGILARSCEPPSRPVAPTPTRTPIVMRTDALPRTPMVTGTLAPSRTPMVTRTEAPPRTPMATGTPTPSGTPAPTATGNPLRTPVGSPTPLGTPTPMANHVVEAEWPARMKVNVSDTIRISLVKVGEQYSATAEVAGHTAVVAAPVSVGTPDVGVGRAFGAECQAYAVAYLAGAAFTKEPLGSAEPKSLDQSPLAWIWNVSSEQPGLQSVDASIEVQWKCRSNPEPVKREIWRSRIEIEVFRPPLTTGQVSVLGLLSGVLGPGLFILSVRETRRKRKKMIKILFLAANPKDTIRLRLDEEMRAIDEALLQAEFHDQFETEQQWAVRVADIQGHLLRHRPDIVHFSGHGSATSEIVLEDDTGTSQPVSVRALSQLFAVLKDNIKCVVLNACYSQPQAEAIAEHIDCVIGMSKAIGDEAAVDFAAAFYRALGFGKSIKVAFDLGCNQINLQGLNEQDTPKLLAKRRDPKEIVLVNG